MLVRVPMSGYFLINQGYFTCARISLHKQIKFVRVSLSAYFYVDQAVQLVLAVTFANKLR